MKSNMEHRNETSTLISFDLPILFADLVLSEELTALVGNGVRSRRTGPWAEAAGRTARTEDYSSFIGCFFVPMRVSTFGVPLDPWLIVFCLGSRILEAHLRYRGWELLDLSKFNLLYATLKK
jgi:hypothetical protein